MQVFGRTSQQKAKPRGPALISFIELNGNQEKFSLPMEDEKKE